MPPPAAAAAAPPECRPAPAAAGARLDPRAAAAIARADATWSAEDLATLRRLYPAGGVAACMRALRPRHGRYAIVRKARAEGVARRPVLGKCARLVLAAVAAAARAGAPCPSNDALRDAAGYRNRDNAFQACQALRRAGRLEVERGPDGRRRMRCLPDGAFTAWSLAGGEVAQAKRRAEAEASPSGAAPPSPGREAHRAKVRAALLGRITAAAAGGVALAGRQWCAGICGWQLAHAELAALAAEGKLRVEELPAARMGTARRFVLPDGAATAWSSRPAGVPCETARALSAAGAGLARARSTGAGADLARARMAGARVASAIAGARSSCKSAEENAAIDAAARAAGARAEACAKWRHRMPTAAEAAAMVEDFKAKWRAGHGGEDKPLEPARFCAASSASGAPPECALGRASMQAGRDGGAMVASRARRA